MACANPLFQAHAGAVTFKGRPLSEMRAIVWRHRLVVIALHLKAKPMTAERAWGLANQLRAALSDARDQRRLTA